MLRPSMKILQPAAGRVARTGAPFEAGIAPRAHGRAERIARLALLALATAALSAACGSSGEGGDAGSGSAPTPAPAPSPPSPTPPSPPSSPTPSPPAPAPAGVAMLGRCTAFPATAIFNTRIDDVARFPAHGSSATWIAAVGSTRALHPDWGSTENPSAADYYGIPLNLLAAGTPETDWPGLAFIAGGAPDESDCAVASATGGTGSSNGYAMARNCQAQNPASLRFPIPRDAVLKAEGGTCNDPATCGDRHVLVVEQGACRLWESYFTYRTAGGQWTAYSTAAWDLGSNAMRPDTWTSGDAAGLPIAPLLVRASEASAGEIPHALRVTFRDAVLANTYIWPARHRAGNSSGSIPFGALLRLKGSFTIPSSWTTQARAIATAMQRHGLYVADIGSDLYVQGDPSVAWIGSTISQVQSLRMSDFEFVDLGVVTRDTRFDGNSYAASW